MDDDDTGIDPAIAAQMGFTSFGAKGTKMKRKYHDASFVEGQEDQETKQKKHAGSGANNVALGARNRIENTEIAADTSHEHSEGQVLSGSASDDPKSLEGKMQSGDKKKGKKAAPSGLAAFLSRGQMMPEPAKPAIDSKDPAATEVESETPAATGTVDPATTLSMATASDKSGASRTNGPPQQAYRYGVKNEHGDMAYFLPSFLEDPWEELRTAAG
ncbi:hypothetical protein MBLNU457_2251t1 [Dothideomycetes sp. NU457]